MIKNLKLVATLLTLVTTACQPAMDEPTAGPASSTSPPAEHTADQSAAIVRPVFETTTEEAYDLTAIGAYAPDHQSIYDHIDANLADHLGAIQRWLRQPSISAQDVGIDKMATMVRDDLASMGFQEAELVPTDGHPGVWGYYDAGAEKTLAVYLMYDVQPVDPDDWQSPPFAAELIDHDLGKVIMARGATNQKGPQRAFLNALQSIIEVNGTLPVNIMITAEGEEELGSPNYAQIIDAYEERLKLADGVLFPFNSQSPEGKITLILGVKGILYLEMTATGGDWGGPSESEIHGSYKAIVDSPVWRLVQALGSMTSEDGNTILIPGYYDGIHPPTDEESRLINAWLPQWAGTQTREMMGVSRWIDDTAGIDTIMDLLYLPTLNIDGIWGGYTEEGVKTILPHQAAAKVDSRLPPGLDPDAALAKIRAHLDALGYDDIKLQMLSGYPAAQTSVSSSAVQAAISVFRKYADTLSVNPRIAGSAPFYQFTDRLGLPLVPAGLGFGTGAHAPNEIMLIEPAEGVAIAGLAEIEKAYVDFVFALAKPN